MSRSKFRSSNAPTSVRRRGISLIELLVVVAIIALLFAVVFPQLGQAREQGRIVKCCSNLRQVNIFHGMYLEQEKWPTWHVGLTYNGWSFAAATPFIYGGFLASKLDPGLPNMDAYILPTEQRPLNAVIIKPGVQGHQPIDLYQCPSDDSYWSPRYPIGLPGTDQEVPSPTWEFTGLSYPINWYWMEYFVTNGVASMSTYIAHDGMPSFGRGMLKRKVGGPAGRFVMFYEHPMGLFMRYARPDGSSDAPRRRGWHRAFSKYTVGFLDGSAVHRYIDTKWTVDPQTASWTTWPEPKTVTPDLWYP